jgi:flagellar protein FliO/FliZ
LFSIKKLGQVCLALGIVLFSIAMPAYAENLDQSVKDMYKQPKLSTTTDQNKETTKTEESTISSSSVGLSVGDFLRMIFAMIFVVALLYFVLRFISKKTKSYQKANFIENLGGTNLGSNRSIQLVKVGNRVLIVGVGEDIQLLTEIEDEAERKQLLVEYNQKMDQIIQPSDVFSKLKNKWIQPKSSMNNFSSELKSQLDQMKQNRKQLAEKLDEKGRDDE